MTDPFDLSDDALVVEADAIALAERIGAELARWAHAHARRRGDIALTGGTIATKAYRSLAARGLRPIDCEHLHVWWGDERFVCNQDPDRNCLQALTALLPRVPLVGENVHPMPSSDDVDTPEEAAWLYAEELGDTVFDLCLLGLGSDGHVASIFPSFDDPVDVATIGVEGAPKPPPQRISLTTARLCTSAEIWFVVSGIEKADAVAQAYHADRGVPGGRVRGVRRTRWFLDVGAAAKLG